MKKSLLVVGFVILAGLGAAAYFALSPKPQPKPSAEAPAPTISLSSELAGQSLGGTQKITVTTGGAVKRVEFFIDGSQRYVSYNAPFTYSLDTTSLTDGNHTLTAKAFNVAGRSSSSQPLTLTIKNAVATAETPTPTSSASDTTPATPTPTTSRTSSSHPSSAATPTPAPTPSPTPPPTPDTAAPSTPAGLTVLATDSWTTRLSWAASTDNVGVTGYRIYRDGVQVGTSATASYRDLATTAGNDYTYAVAAVDAAANLSSQSLTVGLSLPTLSVWSGVGVPGTQGDADTGSIEVGIKIRPKVNGYITGVRFWKASINTGTHVGNLWTTSGTNLATATFTGETTEGWQTVTFATPVAVTAGTIYLASYFAPGGHYAGDANYFTSAGFDNGYIEALQDGAPGVGHSAAYQYSGSSVFPSNLSTNGANYWVDVTFAPTKGLTATTRVTGGSAGNFQGYPDASTTGVPAGTALSLYPRSILVPANVDNLAIADLDITGNIDTYGDNTTIKDTRITSKDFWGVNQRSTATDLSADHLTIIGAPGQGPDNGGEDYALSNGSGGAFTVTNSDLSLFGTGIQTATGDLEGNYIHDLQTFIPLSASTYYHTDAIISGGGLAFGLIIRHNTLLNQTDPNFGGTAAAGLFGDFTNQFNVILDNNYLAGGTYSIYGGDTGSHDMTITNNKISTIFWPNGGFYGPVAHYVIGASGSTWSGNVWADGPSAGQAIAPAF